MPVPRFRPILLSLIVLLFLGRPVHAAAPEYRVKAAMLANFALFVDWPATAYAAPDSPFVACVLGADPFGEHLKTELGDRIGSHPARVRGIHTPQEGRGCHIVFISKSEQSRLEQVLALLRGSYALIVSDVPDTGRFCSLGGMVALKTEGGKIGFELNATQAAKNGLELNSKLKRLARSTDCGERK